MKLQKQQVYLPTEVEKELPKDEVCAINNKGKMLVGYIKEDNLIEKEENFLLVQYNKGLNDRPY